MKLKELIEWLGGDAKVAKELGEKYYAAFQGPGIPDAAVKSYIERVFPGLRVSITEKVSEAVRAEFSPKAKGWWKPAKENADG